MALQKIKLSHLLLIKESSIQVNESELMTLAMTHKMIITRSSRFSFLNFHRYVNIDSPAFLFNVYTYFSGNRCIKQTLALILAFYFNNPFYQGKHLVPFSFLYIVVIFDTYTVVLIMLFRKL